MCYESFKKYFGLDDMNTKKFPKNFIYIPTMICGLNYEKSLNIYYKSKTVNKEKIIIMSIYSNTKSIPV